MAGTKESTTKEGKPSHDGAPAAESQHAPSPAPVSPPSTPAKAADAPPPPSAWRKWLIRAAVVVAAVVAMYFAVPTVVTMLNTVSTDDAYVNGHVTFVAPR